MQLAQLFCCILRQAEAGKEFAQAAKAMGVKVDRRKKQLVLEAYGYEKILFWGPKGGGLTPEAALELMKGSHILLRECQKPLAFGLARNVPPT